MKYILIIGAKSDIAKEIAIIYAKNGYNLYLVCRNSKELDSFCSDLHIRYTIDVKAYDFNVVSFDTHKDFYDSLLIKPFGTIFVAGYMAEQEKCEANFNTSLNTINVNYTGAVSILNIVSQDYKKTKQGFIVGISSVAGDRGRSSNYIYGSSKAALTSYLSGLRNSLSSYGIPVLTVKPGFVYTQMTKNMDLPKLLTNTPQNVAKEIFKAQQKGKNVIYTKKIWWLIMLIIKHIPEFVFKKIKL
jgi:short-subunit dehydrogenase